MLVSRIATKKLYYYFRLRLCDDINHFLVSMGQYFDLFQGQHDSRHKELQQVGCPFSSNSVELSDPPQSSACPSIFSEPWSVNGGPDFIWPSVIQAAGIFRRRLAVAAAAKAFDAPPSFFPTLSLKDSGHFSPSAATGT